ncbi:MAG: type I-U CRISPR-associated protein Csx17 [Gammaproteobacteria bacterium]|nr:type I-U CRISPR-associated protein Csx17 [Gammaproteobacteria bacterium]
MAESITFDGCTPTPLASYLKALGVLRLISSDANHVDGRAADRKARGWWEGERFHIRTTLDRDALCRFFRDEYAPSPIIAPWNGRAGFLEGDDKGASDTKMRPKARLVGKVETSADPRFTNIRKAIKTAREERGIIRYNKLRATVKSLDSRMKDLAGEEEARANEEKRKAESEAKAEKARLLPRLRSNAVSLHVSYIDACYALSTENHAAPLLVGGGVDGSRDFGANFIEAVGELFDLEAGTPVSQAPAELSVSLFASCEQSIRHGSLGLFTPVQSGLKSTTGLEVGADKEIYPLNSWDVALAMEGTLVFVGALTRRWGATGDSRAAFPFTFDPVDAGAGGLSVADANRPRGEIWIPLWHKPATFFEVSAIFAEGRLTLGRQAARTGLDAARSVMRMGQARGIHGFERYSLIQPDSKKPFQATPLGRFNAPNSPRPDLIADLEVRGWLETARSHVGGNKSPANAKAAMRRFHDALFQMTDARQSGDGTRNALIALGGIVRWMTSNRKVREAQRPPPLMHHRWMHAADDGSPEFRVAAALAGLGLAGQTADERALPMAAHFAPIDEDCFVRDEPPVWSASTTTPNVVWGTGGLVSNMVAVLQRRLVEAAVRGLADKPFASASHARLADVGAFLSGDFDDSRCAALLSGLIWVRPRRMRANTSAPFASVPFAYAALKPLFAPDATLRRIGLLTETARLPVPAELVAHLRAGGNRADGRATDAAVRRALARARSSGVPSPFHPARSGGRAGVAERSCYGAGLSAERLAAALLIPIDDYDLKTLTRRAYTEAPAEPDDDPMEDTTDAP